MLEYDEIIKKIKKGDFLFKDKDGDNLLQSLIKNEEQNRSIPIEYAQMLLKAQPELANIPDKYGQLPCQLLDGYQVEGRTSNRPLRRLLYKYMTPSPLRENLGKTAYMSFIEQMSKDENNGLDYRVISEAEAETLLQKPVVLFFSGRGNFELSLINGFGRKIRKTMGLHHAPLKGIKTVSVRYPGNQRDLYNDYVSSHHDKMHSKTDHPVFYIKHFVEKYLRPLYLDEHGKPRALHQAMRNCRRLNLIGYSYGSSIIQGIAEIMTKDMLRKGFTPRYIKQIQSQILALNIAPNLDKKHYKNDFRSYHLINTKDDFMMEFLSPILLRQQGETKDLERTFLKEQGNQIVLLINTLKNNTQEGPHHISTYCREANQAQKIALRWGKYILFNGMNNSIENENSDYFEPLPMDLEHAPKKLLFLRRKPALTQHKATLAKLAQKRKRKTK